MPTGGEIVVSGPDGKSQTIRLANQKIGLGRASSNDLHYPDDPGLSRQHLVVERDRLDWVVRDLNSTNGTFVNSARIQAPHVLRNGDKIQAGKVTIEYRESRGSDTVQFVETTEIADSPGTMLLSRLDEVIDGGAAAARSMGALLKAGQELAGHRPLAELFPLILDLATQAAGASRGVLITVENDDLQVRAAKGDNFRISSAVRDRVLRERASVLVADAMSDDAFRESRTIVEQRVRSIMAVPLQTRDSVIGLIYVDGAHIFRPFTKESLDLLTVMANIAAIRIEQARLVEIEQAERVHARELEQAAEIQLRLLPASAPEFPGLDIAAIHVPCRTVGGDYYDYFPYMDGKVAVIVADVAGKGMPAALMMANVQARIRVLSELQLPPAEMLSRLNKGLITSSPDNRFITFFFAVLDPETGALDYCNAGHNPPLVLRRDGSAESLETGGLPLGLLAIGPYQQGSLKLETGEALVLYSDGVTEAASSGSEDEYGEERLAACIRRQAELPAAVSTAKVMEELRSWCKGEPFADDVTLVVVRFDEQARPSATTADTLFV